MWPPWPFSLLSGSSSRGEDSAKDEEEEELDVYSGIKKRRLSRFNFFLSMAGLSARIGWNKAQTVSSQLFFHLPPAAPVFLLLGAIPVRQKLLETEATAEGYKRIIPLLSNPFARNLALSWLGLAIMSWGHHELNHKQRLTPLPLEPRYLALNRVLLPPFLPEEYQDEIKTSATPNDDRVLNGTEAVTQKGVRDDEEDDDEDTLPIPPRLRRHWYLLVGKAPKPSDLKSTMRSWKIVREQRRLERHNARRLAIYNELLALQSLKRRAKAKQLARQAKDSPKKPTTISSSSSSSSSSVLTPKLGYALVTGASRGIGRALAIELARYEIPLILVARDIDRLGSLAYDIEACYGVKCCILQADLSKPGVAENVFNTTRDAGLRVDVLVNNAGFSMQSPSSMDLPLRELDEMIQLNAVSASTLTHLYGREMKRRRMGRILMLSSICGSVAGLPSVTVYAATKAFLNSLSLGLSKELEPDGVGVTLVLPGAVRDTDFKVRSNSQEALCWKLPFYTKTPQFVAEMAVQATLRGDTECTPGFGNRIFLKVMKPALPQRIHNMIAEMAWNPLRIPPLFRCRPPYPTRFWPYFTPDQQEEPERDDLPPEPHAPIRPRLPFLDPPLLLKLHEQDERVPTTLEGCSGGTQGNDAAGDAEKDREESKNSGSESDKPETNLHPTPTQTAPKPVESDTESSVKL